MGSRQRLLGGDAGGRAHDGGGGFAAPNTGIGFVKGEAWTFLAWLVALVADKDKAGYHRISARLLGSSILMKEMCALFFEFKVAILAQARTSQSKS